MKNGCVFLCEDVLGRNCMVDVFAGGVFLRFLAAASIMSVTLSPGDCLSWRKAFSGMRGCMSSCGIVDDCIATSFLVRGLGLSDAGDREKTGGDLVTSRLVGADEVIGIFLLVVTDVDVPPTAGIGYRCENTRRCRQVTMRIILIKCSIYVFVSVRSVLS